MFEMFILTCICVAAFAGAGFMLVAFIALVRDFF
jgi:hypothetical protein